MSEATVLLHMISLHKASTGFPRAWWSPGSERGHSSVWVLIMLPLASDLLVFQVSQTSWAHGGTVQLVPPAEHLITLDKREAKVGKGSSSWGKDSASSFSCAFFSKDRLPTEQRSSNPVHAMLQSVGMGLSTLKDHCHFRTQRTASVDFTIWICFHLLWGDLSLINHRMLNRLVESFLENHKLSEGLEM